MRPAAPTCTISQTTPDPGRAEAAPASAAVGPNLPLILALLAAAALFLTDVLVPRGIIPAIGYVLVPMLVGESRKRSLVYRMTAGCTVLTWLGVVLEPPGPEPAWVSALNRAMITGALWAASTLVVRRLSLISALAERNEAVERAGEELSRSNAELDRFASRVAHDLRGPLNTIALVAKLLSKTGAGDGPGDGAGDGAEWAARIEGEVRQMSQLIQRLLVYGRAGGGALRPSRCDTEEVLAAVTQSLAGSLRPAGAAVTHDPLPVISADQVLISELLQNLIENAVKYRAEYRPPRVHVSAARSAGEVVFSVCDNGIGIGAQDRATVFRPFTQVDRAASRGGLGLGLATCRRIVERHGGRMWVESTAGNGSTFFFALPQNDPGTREN